MDKNTNSINWFEIPVVDIERAQKFYETIFEIKLNPMPEMMGMKMTGFPAEMGNGKVTGALVKSNFHKPSMEGVRIYLNANPEIQVILDRVEKAGGKILVPKQDLGKDIGCIATLADTEGNSIDLHAQH
jgi:predicted enzyme related to lactoylglutathione lyase